MLRLPLHSSRVPNRILAGAALALLGACATGPGLPDGGAVVTFVFQATPADTLDVLVLDEATIAEAEQYVETGVGSRMPVGPIVRGPGIDPGYPFHYVPAEVRLDDLATEVCDGRPMRTPAEVNQFFQLATGNPNAPSAVWCPWGARPIDVRRR